MNRTRTFLCIWNRFGSISIEMVIYSGYRQRDGVIRRGADNFSLTLSLHWTYTAMLIKAIRKMSHANQNRGTKDATDSKKQPLKHLTVVVGIVLHIKPILELLVVVLCEIEKNRGGFEDWEIAACSVDYDRNTPVRIQFEKPRFLEIKADGAGNVSTTKISHECMNSGSTHLPFGRWLRYRSL